MESYNVIFSGKIAEGYELENVKQLLKSAFGIPDETKINKLFSGGRVVLRRDLSRGDAWKFKQKLSDIGAVAELEEIKAEADTGWLSFDDAATPVSSAQPEPQAHTASPPGLSLEPMEVDRKADDEAAALPERAAFSAREVGVQQTSPAPRPADPASSSTAGLSSGASLAAAQVAAENSNSSGAGGDVTAPPNASGLCWGGFFLGWIWGVFNRSWFGLLGLIPLFSLPVAFVLLFKGRDWAWRNKRWDSVEHFNEVQRKWSIAGLACAVVVGLLWFQVINDITEFTEEEAMQMEEQRQELRNRLDTIEDPQQRKQLEALIDMQEQLQKELEKSG